LCLLLLSPEFDIVNQLVVATIAADTIVFAAAEFDCSHRCEILRILWNLDQILGLASLGNRDLSLFPHARDIGLPCLSHAANEAVGTTKQKHVRAQSVAASENAQVLQDNGLKQGSHQLVWWSTDLLQAVDVGFGENTALACNLMQLDAAVLLLT